MSSVQPPPPPGPYGPPPGPYGAPPGGVVPPPGQWPHQPYPGQQKSKAGFVVLALVLAVVLISAVAGGMYYFRLGPFGSKISADRELQYVVQERFPSTYKPKEGTDDLSGRWWTDKYLVRVMPDQIVGYDLASGKTAYTVDTPDNRYCKASGQQSAKGHIAVLRGTRAEGCREITVVDIVSGKVVWTKKLQPVGASRPGQARAQHFPRFDHRPAILGDRLYVPTDKGTHVLKVSDGAAVETPRTPETGDCFTTHVDVIAQTGFAYRNCSPHGGDKDRHLTAFDASGKSLWTWKLPVVGGRPYLLTGVLSADPVLVRAFGQRKSEIWRIDPKTGKHAVIAEVSRRGPGGPLLTDPCVIAGSDGLVDCSKQAVSNGVLYLRYSQGQGSTLRRGIAAYDVNSGDELWTREWGDGHQVSAPIGVRDGAPIVYLLPKLRDPGALVRVDPKTGAMSAFATVAPELTSSKVPRAGLIAYPDQGVIAYHNDYLAFLKVQAGPRDRNSEATLVLK